jgi:uncharacterized protein (TIGR02118 family)
MRRVLALYPHPKDPEAFRRYYEGTHTPLAALLPGLLASRHSFSVEGLGAASPYFCIWEGDFADAAAVEAAVQSPEGQAVVADIPNYATGGVVIVHYDV